MKWKLVGCVLLLACLLLQAAPVMAEGATVTVPLITREVVVSDIGYYSATISWKTNGDATSQVFYDTVSHDNITGYRYSTGESPTLVFEHSVTLTRLASATTYHYRVRSAIPAIDVIAVSADYPFTTLSIPSGGGGGAAPTPAPTLTPPIAGSGQASWTPTADGLTPATITVTSPDNKSTVTVGQGMRAWDNQGNRLTTITCNPPAVPAPAPPASNIVAVYDLGPSGATFSVPITVTLKYDPAFLPAGAVETSLILAFYNATTGTWIPLDNIMVDTVNHTVSGTTTHFTQFAVLSSIMPTPIPSPSPSPSSSPTPAASPTPTASLSPVSSPSPTPTEPTKPFNWALCIGILAAIVVVMIAVIVIIRRRGK